MKNLKNKTLLQLLLLLMLAGGTAGAQDTTLATVKIKTSAVCRECKSTIEEALAFERGVKKSELHLPSSIITVSYQPAKTTPEKIRKAIAAAGYDADGVAANPKAYKKLSACCKKDNTPH